MDDWKVQTAVNEFTDACTGDLKGLVGAAKRLSRVYQKLRKPEQRKNVMEQLLPLLDDSNAAVRQCAANVLMEVKMERFSSMPEARDFTVYDGKGGIYFQQHWQNKKPQGEQQVEWLEFVAAHEVARGRYE